MKDWPAILKNELRPPTIEQQKEGLDKLDNDPRHS